MKINNLVLFSGGTGGHVIPAVNIGNYLIDYGYYCTLFVDNRGLQYASKLKGRIMLSIIKEKSRGSRIITRWLRSAIVN